MQNFYAIDSLATDAIMQHATPGCVVLVAKDNKIVLDKAYGYLTYDKTSRLQHKQFMILLLLQKFLQRLLSVMKLYDEGKLDIDKTLGDYLPWVRGTNKSNLVIEDVLLHQAGLIAFIPFYKETIDATRKSDSRYLSIFC